MNTEFWSPEEYDGQAQRRYEAGEYDAALEILREGSSLYPTAVELRVSLGYTQMAREEFVRARRAFAEALALEPDHEDGLVGLGESHLRLGERARALAAFERVIHLGFSRDLDLMMSVGRSLLRDGLLEQAERFFRLAVAADDKNAEAAADLAYTLHRRGDPTSARRWLEIALRLDPENHDARTLLGNHLYETGDRLAALAHFELIPARALWDSLTLWRVIELLRACGQGPADEKAVTPYLDRLDELFDELTPEDRLFEELALAEEEHPDPVVRGQMDMFRPGAEAVPLRIDRPRDDWMAVIRLLCRMSPNPNRTVEQFMEDTAQCVRRTMGLALPTDDPGAFLAASARAGVLRLEDVNQRHGR
ncbi:MAG: tetratricopeptide repeat protein [Gemmatimonadota bacterium]